MNSLSVAQTFGKEIRLLKFIYTLDPAILKDLAERFASYYFTHTNKVLKLYYDRSGNARRNEKSTLAEQFKLNLEGLHQGWRVELMSVGWGNVPHEAKRLLWQIILSEKDPQFPCFRLHEANARELKSSMQIAQVIITHEASILFRVQSSWFRVRSCLGESAAFDEISGFWVGHTCGVVHFGV